MTKFILIVGWLLILRMTIVDFKKMFLSEYELIEEYKSKLSEENLNKTYKDDGKYLLAGILLAFSFSMIYPLTCILFYENNIIVFAFSLFKIIITMYVYQLIYDKNKYIKYFENKINKFGKNKHILICILWTVYNLTYFGVMTYYLFFNN